MFGGGEDAEVSGIGLVVFVQRQAGGCKRGAVVHVADVDVVPGLRSFRAETGARQASDVVATVSADDEGDGVIFAREIMDNSDF